MYKVYDSIYDVPREWNRLTKGNVYLKIRFLMHLEETQYTNPKYYMFYDENKKLDSIVYLIHYPEFPFSMNLKSNFTTKMNMVYFPAPLSKKAFVVGEKTKKEVRKVLRKVKGFTLIPNVYKNRLLPKFPYERSFQVVYLDLKWKSFDGYLESMRSQYRRSHQKTLANTENLKVFIQNEIEYSDRLYGLYEQVYDRSDVPLGKQNKEFFDFSEFITISLKLEGKTIGFVSLIPNSEELVFNLVGIDYEYTDKYLIYQRLLLEIVRYAINMKYKTVEFGQTTYDAKLRLGCEHHDTYMQVTHSSKFVLWFALLFRRKLLKKHTDLQVYHVFKNQEGD